MTAITNKHDFVFYFDVQDGNPNGDPDAGNLPRIDPETGHGIVTDVCLKRKLRNYVTLTKRGAPGYDIFVKEKAILNDLIEEAHEHVAPNAKDKSDKTEAARRYMCERFFDVRAFGAVMSTGRNAGQVRGPVQLTFARSVDPIVALEHTITRMAVAKKEEAVSQEGENRTMGRKATIPYGLYRAHGFFSAALAEQVGFSAEDLAVLWGGFAHMFDDDRSAARGLMSARALVIFRHESKFGNAPAHRLFDRVTAARKDQGKPARNYTDYEILVDEKGLDGVSITSRRF
ncbi:MAG TPA: type I-C CRISPR-associated protein Cas7/Csd2 [Planctomycetota bacterium]|nr:type I-C CRISPR-associated protein Cas7/Csd2 [Planctomycetota bacterium]